MSQKICPKKDIRKRSKDAGLKAFFQPKSPQIIKAGGKIKQRTIKICDKNKTYKKDLGRRINPKAKIE